MGLEEYQTASKEESQLTNMLIKKLVAYIDGLVPCNDNVDRHSIAINCLCGALTHLLFKYDEYELEAAIDFIANTIISNCEELRRKELERDFL